MHAGFLLPFTRMMQSCLSKAKTEIQKGKKQDSEMEAPQIPIRKRYLTKDSTLETLNRIHAENPRGMLRYNDELAGAKKAQNQYRNGHGADEEAELDLWSGSAVIVDRADRSICLPRSAISRTGSIQWEVLAELMGDHQDVNGAWSRWLFCAAEAPRRYLRLTENDEDTGIAQALTNLYIQLERLPEQDYLLSYEAKRSFEIWQHQLVDAQQAENAIGMQLIYPKIEAYTARFALWLHIVNAVLRGEQPSQVINGKTMGQAIELAAYYLWQRRLIHAHNAPDSGLTAIALKIQKFVQRVGSATASRLKSGIRDLRKMTTEQIRHLMRTLADSGYGQLIGEGSEMTYLPTSDNTYQAQKEPSASPDRIDKLDIELTEVTINQTKAVIESHNQVDTIDAFSTNAKYAQNLESDRTVNAPKSENAISSKIPNTAEQHQSPASVTQSASQSVSTQNATSIRSQETSLNIEETSRNTTFNVGMLCRYVGSDLRQLKGLNRLKIEALEGDIATVRADGWYISHKVLLSDLAT
jgi:hypothetical protein